MDFSIIIVTAQRKELLIRSIESVAIECKSFLQNSSLEIIAILNDPEDLNTLQYLKSITLPIQYSVVQKGVLGVARNEGIRLAKGKWILF